MDNKIAILFTNDAHCALEPSSSSFGYAGVAGCAAELRKRYGAERICLVDAGDSLGGGVYGLLSAGEVPLDILNVCKYDVYALGNADLTFGMERLAELESRAEFPFLCANLIDSHGTSFFKSYVIKDLGGFRVAFVGALSPYTINVMNPSRYVDGNKGGWHFCQDATGEGLCGAIQRAVDSARQAGAEFVVLVSHLGQAGQVQRWRSDEVVRRTCGIDLVLDGHSHERYLQQIANAEGVEVPVMQAGVSLSDVGVIVVDVATKQIDAGFVERGDIRDDAGVARLVQGKVAPLDKRLQERVGEVPFDLRAKNQDEPTWMIRSRETNLGDLVADAFRAALGAELALVPSWTIRDDLKAGAVALGDVCRVLPLGHDVTSAMLTGRQILDALEYGVRNWPKPCGSFLQVSGMRFAIDPATPSSVVTDDEESFLAVDGARRVWDGCIGDEPLELDRLYSVAAPSFLLKYGSSGFSMLRASSTSEKAVSEVEALASYIGALQSGVLANAYASMHGEERIAVVCGQPTTQFA